jgi:hypothetical protein
VNPLKGSGVYLVIRGRYAKKASFLKSTAALCKKSPILTGRASGHSKNGFTLHQCSRNKFADPSSGRKSKSSIFIVCLLEGLLWPTFLFQPRSFCFLFLLRPQRLPPLFFRVNEFCEFCFEPVLCIPTISRPPARCIFC